MRGMSKSVKLHKNILPVKRIAQAIFGLGFFFVLGSQYNFFDFQKKMIVVPRWIGAWVYDSSGGLVIRLTWGFGGGTINDGGNLTIADKTFYQ